MSALLLRNPLAPLCAHLLISSPEYDDLDALKAFKYDEADFVVVPESYVHKSIHSVNEAVRSINKNVQVTAGYVYSHLFQCYTTPAFYAALLVELRVFARSVDVASEDARRLVWAFIFTLNGLSLKDRQPEALTSPLSPIVQSLYERPKMKPIEIEVMYVAFLLSMNAAPTFMEDHTVSGES